MPRGQRHCPGGTIFHVLNRAVGRRRLFLKDGDYAAFVRVMAQAVERHSMRLLAFCLMPNHWHLLLWPRRDGDVSAFMRWLTVTHSNRHHAHYHTAGQGHLYQGRFKSFAVQDDRHARVVWRYIERNPLRGKMVRRAESWDWSSLAFRLAARQGQVNAAEVDAGRLLCDSCVDLPVDWVERVNQPQTDAEEKAMRQSITRGIPFGAPDWQAKMATKLDISLRPRGRPRKRLDAAERKGS